MKLINNHSHIHPIFSLNGTSKYEQSIYVLFGKFSKNTTNPVVLTHHADKVNWIRQMLNNDDCDTLIICGTGSTGKTTAFHKVLDTSNNYNNIIIIWNFGEMPKYYKKNNNSESDNDDVSNKCIIFRLEYDELARAVHQEDGIRCVVVHFECDPIYRV